MPLDADDKASGGIFDGLDDPIVSERNRTQILSWTAHRLMMVAVHIHLGAAGQAAYDAVFSHTHQMPRRRLGVIFVVGNRPIDKRRDVLDEGTTSMDIQ